MADVVHIRGVPPIDRRSAEAFRAIFPRPGSYRVEILETAEVERLGAAEHDDALAEQRVGEEADTVQLDENRRVSDPA